MRLFSGITEAFNNVRDSISSAFGTISEKVHDVFYHPSEYVSKDVTVTPYKEETYEEWVISTADVGTWNFFHEIFDQKKGKTP